MQLRKKTILNDTDVWNEFVKKFIDDFLSKKNIRRYSRYTPEDVVFDKNFNRTIRIIPGKDVYQNKETKWIDEINLAAKNTTNQSSNNLTPS